MKTLLNPIFVIAVCGTAGLFNPLAGRSATANVAVGQGGNVFVPVTTTINAGDTVLWTWAGNNHSTTSDTSIWDSSVHNKPNSFQLTFISSGSFPYHCTIHGAPGVGMHGSIIVAAANVPPTVSITSPTNSQVFAAPANVIISATAADSDGTVANVQFLNGTTVLTNETASPYSVVASNLTAGSYTLSAVATDNSGANTTNSVSISVVTPVDIVISNPQRTGTNFQFSYTANSGLAYFVQVGTNPTAPNWMGIATNTAAASSVSFTDTNAIINPAYYRVGRLPNP
jgi:plastocyanin